MINMIGSEQRPGLGIDVSVVRTNSGARVLPSFWLSRGSGWVPVENIPQPDGKITRVGSSEPVMGQSGKEILWSMGLLEPKVARELVTGYVADNGYNGDPKALQRALEMMQ